MNIGRSLVIAAVLLCAWSSGAQDKRGKPCSGADLVGTWRVASVDAKPRPADYPVHKHLTGTHFIVIGWNPQDNSTVTRVHGGPYTAADGIYAEEIEYGFGAPYDQLRAAGGKVEFTCRVEGNQWHIEGKQGGAYAASETWVRVDPSSSASRR
jgi:hypothetical protein